MLDRKILSWGKSMTVLCLNYFNCCDSKLDENKQKTNEKVSAIFQVIDDVVINGGVDGSKTDLGGRLTLVAGSPNCRIGDCH